MADPFSMKNEAQSFNPVNIQPGSFQMGAGTTSPVTPSPDEITHPSSPSGPRGFVGGGGSAGPQQGETQQFDPKKIMSKEDQRRLYADIVAKGDDPKKVFQDFVDKGYHLDGLDESKRKAAKDAITQKQNAITNPITGQPVDNEPGALTNAAGGVLQSVTGAPKLLGSLMSEGLEKLGIISPEIAQAYRDQLYSDESTDIGQNRDSLVTRGAEGATDIAQLLTPTGIGAKGVGMFSKIPGAENVIADIAKFMGKTAPAAGEALTTAQKVSNVAKGAAKLGAEGAAVTAKGDVLQGELPTPGELGAGGAVNVALGGAGNLLTKGYEKFIAEAPEKLYSSTIKLNPSQIKKIQLPNVAGEAPEKWLIKNKISGNLDEITEKLNKKAEDAYNQLNSYKSKIKGTYTSESSKQILDELSNLYKGTVGNEQRVNEIGKLLGRYEKQGGQLARSDLVSTKRLLDKSMKLFKTSGEGAEGAVKEGLQNLRGRLKGNIEKIAKNNGISDVQSLSKDIQVSYAIEDALQNTVARESKNNIFGLTSMIMGGGAGAGEYARSGDPIKSMGAAASVMIGKHILDNPAIKTSLAIKLSQLRPSQQEAITKVINGGQGTQDTYNTIGKIFEELGMGTRKAISAGVGSSLNDNNE